MPEFYSVKEFAVLLKVTPLTIRRAIKNGRIAAFKIGSSKNGVVRIHEGQISRLMIIDTISIEDNDENMDSLH